MPLKVPSHLEALGQRVVLNLESHLVRRGQERHDSVLVPGHPDVLSVDGQQAVAHAQSPGAGGGASGDDLGDEDAGLAGAERDAGVVGAADDAQAERAARLDKHHVLRFE